MKKSIYLLTLFTALSAAAVSAATAAPVGSATVYITVNARVGIALQEVQRCTFANQLVIDPQSGSDHIFLPNTDQIIKGTNGAVFNVKVSSINGTAVNQACTANGVSGMQLRSASSPTDTIPYTFMCTGDTEGMGQFRGAGYNTPKALGITIKVAGSAAQTAAARTDYTDTITMLISY